MTKVKHVFSWDNGVFKLIDNCIKHHHTTHTTLFESADLNSYLLFLESKGLWSVDEYLKFRS